MKGLSNSVGIVMIQGELEVVKGAFFDAALVSSWDTCTCLPCEGISLALKNVVVCRCV